MLPKIVAAAALLGLSAGVAAQTSPSVVRANTEAARHIAARQAGHEAINADLQAQYADDMASYRRQAQARRQIIAHDQRRYDHQQRAYADAMRAWRIQADACKRGHPRACHAPTPDPADFW